MAWILPATDGWNVSDNGVDAYNQMVSVCNSARGFYNAMRSAITGTTVNIAALSTISTNAQLQDAQIWQDLQERIWLLLYDAIDYDRVTSTAHHYEYQYRITYEADNDAFGDKVNGFLTTAGIPAGDHINTKYILDWDSGSDQGIPFDQHSNQPFTTLFNYAPARDYDDGYTNRSFANSIHRTRLWNQMWGACKCIQELTLWGCQTAFLFPTYDSPASNYSLLNNETTGTIFSSSGADCPARRTSLSSNYDAATLFGSTGGSRGIVRTTCETASSSWSIDRDRCKITWDTLEAGDLKTWAVLHNITTGVTGYLDFDSLGAEKDVVSLVESTGHTAATNSTGYYGNHTGNPLTNHPTTLVCNASPSNYSQAHVPCFALKTSISDLT